MFTKKKIENLKPEPVWFTPLAITIAFLIGIAFEKWSHLFYDYIGWISMAVQGWG